MSNEFKREERYVVLKIKDLEFNSPSGDINKRSKELGEWISRNSLRTRECVVVESDWPEYHLVWAMIEHRMAGKPVPDFNLWRRADELQKRLTATDERADLLEGLLRNVRNKLSFGPEDTKAIDAALRVSAGVRCTSVPVAKVKPVAKLHAERLTGKDGEYGITVEDSQWFNTCRLTGGEFNLYAEQPAPVAVVMPDRANAMKGSHDHQSGWNACLEELKRLNPSL